MPKVQMFKAMPCPYCSAAYRFLTEIKGVEVEQIDLTGDRQARMDLMQKTGQRTVPQIFVGGVHVGGYDDMRALDRRGGLDPLLAG
jgi:glutaredoxin 3